MDADVSVYNAMQCRCGQTFDQIASNCTPMPRATVASSVLLLLQQGCIAMSFDFRVDPTHVPTATWYACKSGSIKALADIGKRSYSRIAYVFY